MEKSRRQEWTPAPGAGGCEGVSIGVGRKYVLTRGRLTRPLVPGRPERERERNGGANEELDVEVATSGGDENGDDYSTAFRRLGRCRLSATKPAATEMLAVDLSKQTLVQLN